ncbi:Cell wall alpha-1,3-glucan synthase ags1, partial [Borealophlyctis nickersoniae]
KWALPADALELKQIEQFKDYGKDKPFDTFNDEDGAAVAEFERNLKDLTVKSSTTHQAIDTFLTKTSTQYFQQLFKDRLHVDKTSLIPAVADDEESSRGGRQVLAGPRKRGLELLCAKIVQKRLGDWPVYSIFLTLGQLLSATSFQLVLLTGGSTTSDSMFYKITAIFLLATVAWTLFYRHYSFNHSVSLPFFLYAVALFLVGAPNLIIGSDTVSFQEPALYVYAFTSASGSLFFGLNFGEEADASTRTWVARAGIVEGGRLMWVSALWYWGKLLAEGVAGEMTDGPGLWVTAVCWGCAVLFFGIGGMLHKGLPDFYRASPPSIPAEFRTLFRR